MARQANLTGAECARILALKARGMKAVDISKEVQRSLKTVYRVLTNAGHQVRGPHKVKRLAAARPQALPKVASPPTSPRGAFGLPLAPGIFTSPDEARRRLMAGR